MLKMSFYDHTLNKKKLKKVIEETDKPIEFTYGFEYRNPTICHKPITKEEALEIIDKECFLDAKENEKLIHLNAFSVNDMW